MNIAQTNIRLRGLLTRAILYWLPIAAAVTALAGLIYVVVQQNYRQSANDPQIQLAEDSAARLGSGAQPQAVVGADKIDLVRSLAPFLIVYDDKGNPVASSAQLNGQAPPLPVGVFSSVRESGEDRLTWQPQEGVREAAVIVQFGGSQPGFVLAGRSLTEVEKRVDQLTWMVGVGWLATMLGTLVACAVVLLVGDKVLPKRAS
ncbi:MAG TPA: hypothetical protein VLQ48_06445 [Chloroflexia bacterium]|nr:hypothetical protein [Chloroflexia bacterium]